MGVSPFTEAQRQEMREMMQRGIMRKIIAKKFGCSPQSVSRACAGITPAVEHRGAHYGKKNGRFLSRPWEEDGL